MGMIKVESDVFRTIMNEHSNHSPEPDFTEEDSVTEDYWDQKREKVVGYVRWFNDGGLIQCVLEELIPKEQLC